MQNIYTDLAYERYKTNPDLPGCRYEEEALGLCHLHTLYIENEEAQRATGCTVGTYRTLFFPSIATAGEYELEEIIEHLASLLARKTKKLLGEDHVGKRILIAALGNRNMTADAVGPRAADGVCATAHLKECKPDLLNRLHCAEIALLSPGTLAQSGIESAELITAAADLFHPHLVIAIDALAARATERLATTIQITDTGISPGAGIGNPRAALSHATLGCPVISIGAPTVVNAATLTMDLLDRIRGKISKNERERLAAVARDFFVSSREADIISTRYATVIAQAINRTFGVPHL